MTDFLFRRRNSLFEKLFSTQFKLKIDPSANGKKCKPYHIQQRSKKSLNSSNRTLGEHFAEGNGYSIAFDNQVMCKQITFRVTCVLDALFSCFVIPEYHPTTYIS